MPLLIILASFLTVAFSYPHPQGGPEIPATTSSTDTFLLGSSAATTISSSIAAVPTASASSASAPFSRLQIHSGFLQSSTPQYFLSAPPSSFAVFFFDRPDIPGPSNPDIPNPGIPDPSSQTVVTARLHRPDLCAPHVRRNIGPPDLPAASDASPNTAPSLVPYNKTTLYLVDPSPLANLTTAFEVATSSAFFNSQNSSSWAVAYPAGEPWADTLASELQAWVEGKLGSKPVLQKTTYDAAGMGEEGVTFTVGMDLRVNVTVGVDEDLESEEVVAGQRFSDKL